MVDPKAITKARSRLRVARQALEDMRKPVTFETAGDFWYVFLVAAKNVYTALEKGCKDSAQDRQWFGAKKQERKNDSLLQYFFQARDDDEHGLEAVVELKPGFTQIIGDGKFSAIGGRVISVSPGMRVSHQEPRVGLKAITDRGGNVYSPPTKHLGKDVTVSSPGNLGQLALAYLEALVAEAEKRP